MVVGTWPRVESAYLEMTDRVVVESDDNDIKKSIFLKPRTTVGTEVAKNVEINVVRR